MHELFFSFEIKDYDLADRAQLLNLIYSQEKVSFVHSWPLI